MSESKETPTGKGKFFPFLMPASWKGAEGNDCCRRLFGSSQNADLDPWVALGLTSDEESHIHVLPPGGMSVLSELFGHPVDLDYAEQLACTMLDQHLQDEDVQISPLAGQSQEVSQVILEDFAASIILMPHVLTAVQASFQTERLFVAIPTRASIYFAGTPGGAVMLGDVVATVHGHVTPAAHLTAAVFLTENGELKGLSRDASRL